MSATVARQGPASTWGLQKGIVPYREACGSIRKEQRAAHLDRARRQRHRKKGLWSKAAPPRRHRGAAVYSCGDNLTTRVTAVFVFLIVSQMSSAEVFDSERKSYSLPFCKRM